MTGIEEWLKKIKDEFCSLIKTTLGLTAESALKESEIFLQETETDLREWWSQLKNNQIEATDLEWLVKSRLDALQLTLLKTEGLTLAAVDRVKNGIVNIILSNILRPL